MNESIEKEEGADPKERILQSAIEEFGHRGYEAASTNVIVHNAGVSKGLLFHYFGSKKSLYLECSVHVMNILSEYIMQGLSVVDSDMFSLLKKMLKIKLQFYKDNPAFIGLVGRAWYSEDRSELEDRLPTYAKGYGSYAKNPVFKHVDRSRLRDDMDFAKVVEYTALLMEAGWLRFSAKYDKDYAEIPQHLDEYLAEVDEMLDLLKRGAYK